MNGRTRFMVGLGLVLVVTMLVVWASSSSEPRDESSEQTVEGGGHTETPDSRVTGHATRSSGVPRDPHASTSSTTGRSSASNRNARDTTTADAGRGRRAAGAVVHDRRDELTTTNAAIAVPHGTQGWDDPTNERVLGPRDWMAAADEDERARIDEVFEKSRAARFDPRLSNRDRGESVAAMKAVVDACFEALRERSPSATGRLIVAWTAGANGGQGWIADPRIKVNYRLEDDVFEACILDGAQNLRFPAAEGEAIAVEAPFFYDGAY